jgi:hypothetical protein
MPCDGRVDVEISIGRLRELPIFRGLREIVNIPGLKEEPNSLRRQGLLQQFIHRIRHSGHRVTDLCPSAYASHDETYD